MVSPCPHSGGTAAQENRGELKEGGEVQTVPRSPKSFVPLEVML